jgi:hypothetical protein
MNFSFAAGFTTTCAKRSPASEERKLADVELARIRPAARTVSALGKNIFVDSQVLAGQQVTEFDGEKSLPVAWDIK